MTVSGITPGYYVEWPTRYLGIQVTHGWGIEEHDQERNIVSRETFNGTAPLIWFARPLFRLFRVRRMTQRSLRARAQRAELENNLDHVNQVLKDGAAKARALARTVVDRAKKASGLG